MNILKTRNPLNILGSWNPNYLEDSVPYKNPTILIPQTSWDPENPKTRTHPNILGFWNLKYPEDPELLKHPVILKLRTSWDPETQNIPKARNLLNILGSWNSKYPEDPEHSKHPESLKYRTLWDISGSQTYQDPENSGSPKIIGKIPRFRNYSVSESQEWRSFFSIYLNPKTKSRNSLILVSRIGNSTPKNYL